MDISTKGLYDSLDKIYAISDNIDENGGGVKALTFGLHSTRETVKTELLNFLLHIISGNETVTQAQADVFSIVLEGDLPPDVIQESAQKCKERTPYEKIFSLFAFLIEDATYSKAEGKIITQRSDLLNDLFRMFGDILLLAGNSRAMGSLLMERFLLGMKQYSYKWISEHSNIQE